MVFNKNGTEVFSKMYENLDTWPELMDSQMTGGMKGRIEMFIDDRFDSVTDVIQIYEHGIRRLKCTTRDIKNYLPSKYFFPFKNYLE